MEARSSDNEAKLSIIIAAVLVITVLIDFRISAAIATAYLIGYAVYRMRKARRKATS